MINWFNHMYPYGNLHELNLDWVIATVKRGEKDIADFIGINTIKYADPILWNIESQYEANTVVVDGQTGNAYISVKAVPNGVHLNRTDYWTQIYNYSNVVDTLREQIAHNEGDTTTATQSFVVGDLVFVRTLLYRVIAPMIAGDSFVENSNIVKTTIEEEMKLVSVAIQNEALARDNADTQLQTNIDSEALARGNADTQLQTNIDNEVLARGNADTQLQTNIDNEVLARGNADTQLQTNIDVLNNSIGNISNLETTNKNNLVGAINEIYNKTIGVNKRIITIADSYGEYPSVAESWQSLLSNYIADSQFINLHEGSTGIYHIGNNGHNAQTLLSSSNISTPETVSDIIIALGVNDYNDSLADVSSAYDNLITYIKNTFINAKIWFAFAGNKTDANITQRNNLVNLCKLMQDKCNGDDCFFMDGVQYVMHNQANVISDNVHPNSNGAQALAVAIGSAYVNHGHYRYIYSGTSSANLTGGTSATIRYYIDNNMSTIIVPDIASSSTFTFYANSWALIGTIDTPVLNTFGLVPVIVQVYSTQTEYPETLSVLINNNQIYGKLAKDTSISVLQLNNFIIYIPTILA